MSAVDEGRTEEATEKQRQKFRDEGSVAKSQEFGSMMTFLAGYIMLMTMGGYIAMSMGDVMRITFAEVWKLRVPENIVVTSFFYTEWYLLLLLPLFAALFFAVMMVNIVQVGWHISWKAIRPKFSKVNAFANVKKVLISKQSLVELLKSIVKMSVLSYLAYLAVRPLIGEFASLNQLTPMQIGLKTWEYASDIWLFITAFMLIIGFADFAWQKHQLEEKMMMRPQDVEDEQKQSTGDPKVKREQRLRGMRMLQELLSEQTREADVVITNPTHFAVALQYRHGEMTAPKVVAKGVDHMALKIRKIARKEEIPIVENRGLARALYYGCDVSQEIPNNLFRPVAEILAFVFKLGQERKTANG